ncbi:MAG: peptidase U32 family protein, partial [Candidatus Izemoplasmatales bacterium]
MKRVELLAPAGDKLSFIGAINAGADAIYLSMKKFGARSFANNFDMEELISLIEYAHLRNVKIYVTVNTVIYDYEFESLIESADILVKNHVDAFIIQDLGVLEVFSKRYPFTELHASTQMNTINIDQARFLKSKGIKRIILAREVSLKEIKEIKENLDIEIEVFIHGALCISYSGNCYFSSMIGKRSGNRGECAQSCRLPYELYKDNQLIEEKAYLLSAKDLITIDYIQDLISAGITSFKIEGRMRKPEYVIQTVLSYKKAIQKVYDKIDFNIDEEKKKLTSVFNRGQTKGFLLSEKPKNIVNTTRPNHIGIP